MLLQFSEHLLEVEARRLLSLRILLERHEEITDVALGGHEQEDVIHQPVVVRVRGDVGAFVRVGPEIEDLRDAAETVQKSQAEVDALQRRLDAAPPAQRARLEEQLAETRSELAAGLEMFIRYPVPLEDASGVDDRVTRALLDAIEREPSLKLASASSPTLQPAQ